MFRNLFLTSCSNYTAQNTPLDEAIGYVDSNQILFSFPDLKEYDKLLKEAESIEDKDVRESSVANLKFGYVIRKNEIWQPVYKEIQDTIDLVRKRRKMAIILKSGQVVSGGMDITEEVITEIKTRQKSK